MTCFIVDVPVHCTWWSRSVCMKTQNNPGPHHARCEPPIMDMNEMLMDGIKHARLREVIHTSAGMWGGVFVTNNRYLFGTIRELVPDTKIVHGWRGVTGLSNIIPRSPSLSLLFQQSRSSPLCRPVFLMPSTMRSGLDNTIIPGNL